MHTRHFVFQKKLDLETEKKEQTESAQIKIENVKRGRKRSQEVARGRKLLNEGRGR